MIKNLLKNNPIIFVDIGAAGGMHKRWLKLGSNIKSILFEPDEEEYKKLNFNKSDNSVIINAAVADNKKLVDFNICKKQEVSSIYKPNLNLINKYDEAQRFEVERTVSMQADSLNSLLKVENINDVDFMKIDTQGSELDILKGATNYLDNIIGLEVEVEFVQLYHEQPLFFEVNTFIESNGFSLIDLRKSHWKRERKNYSINKGQLIFADALYFKEPEKILEISGLNQEKIVKTIFVYLTYGYHDFARVLFDLSKKNNFLSTECEIGIKDLLRRHNTEFVFPDFKGKDRIKNFFNYLSNKFNSKDSFSGTETKLGN